METEENRAFWLALVRAKTVVSSWPAWLQLDSIAEPRRAGSGLGVERSHLQRRTRAYVAEPGSDLDKGSNASYRDRDPA